MRRGTTGPSASASSARRDPAQPPNWSRTAFFAASGLVKSMLSSQSSPVLSAV